MPRWKQCNKTGKFIPIDDSARKLEGSAAIHGIIEPFVSPIDGSIISDRKGLREHNKRNGVVAASEFSMGYYEDKAKERARLYTGEKTQAEKQRRGEEINNIINHLERR